MSGLPLNCAMLARAEQSQDPGQILPMPIWNIIVAIGKQRWVFQRTRNSETPPEIGQVIPQIIDDKLKGVISFFTL